MKGYPARWRWFWTVMYWGVAPACLGLVVISPYSYVETVKYLADPIMQAWIPEPFRMSFSGAALFIPPLLCAFAILFRFPAQVEKPWVYRYEPALNCLKFHLKRKDGGYTESHPDAIWHGKEREKEIVYVDSGFTGMSSGAGEYMDGYAAGRSSSS